MYNYDRVTVGNFYVYIAETKVGDTHRRVFDPGITTENQWTVNVYLSGKYEIVDSSTRNVIQIYDSGSTSIDQVLAYPSEVEIVERVLQPGIRICTEPTGKVPNWSRRVESTTFATKPGDMIIDLSTPEISITNVTASQSITPAGRMLVCSL